MRIISQCKTKSVEFYNIALLRRDETIFARTANQDMVLAEYKNPARAAEVFEELNFLLLASWQISTTCRRNKQWKEN